MAQMAVAAVSQAFTRLDGVIGQVFAVLPPLRPYLPKAYLSWADAVDKDIIQFFVPGLKVVSPARNTLPWSTFAEAFALCGLYALIVLIGFLRKGMNSKPVPEFLVKPAMIVYNAVQVILCAWMSWRAFEIGVLQKGFGFSCNAFEPKDTSLVFVLHVFYLSKVLDFLDTVFMIARSSWRQLSFLHIYHHFSIFITYYLVSSATWTGDIWYTITANSFIHTVMYLYYFLGCFGIKPWWGRLLTQMQLIQFLSMNAQAIINFQDKCPFPNRVTAYYLAYIVSLFLLFRAFYNQRWEKKGAEGAAAGASKVEDKKRK